MSHDGVVLLTGGEKKGWLIGNDPTWTSYMGQQNTQNQWNKSGNVFLRPDHIIARKLRPTRDD
jgi:hypothetical protein